MGQKVNPTGFRLGVIKGWESRWYANSHNYRTTFTEDRKLREYIRKELASASISRIEIERIAGTQLDITIHTAKPGIVIGRNGERVERLRATLERLAGKKKVHLKILEIRNPDVEANLVARSIAEQLEKRIAFRRAMKQAVQKAMRGGAKGILVTMGGRLGGAEIARTEKESQGSVPLQTLRADIDYGLAEAHTTYGVIGVKVWIYHGDVLPSQTGLRGVETAMAALPAGGERAPRGGERSERDRRAPRGGGAGGERAPRTGAGAGARGPRTGAGAPTGERRPSRPAATGGLNAERGPRSGGQGTRGGGGGGTRAPRPPQAQSSGPIAGGTVDTPNPITAAPAGPVPHGTIKPTEEGPAFPAPGPVTPAPASHEFPAPTANEDATEHRSPGGAQVPDQPGREFSKGQEGGEGSES